jgi:hypothetical protein
VALYYFHDKALLVEPVEAVHRKVHNKMDLPLVEVHERVLNVSSKEVFRKIRKMN